MGAEDDDEPDEPDEPDALPVDALAELACTPSVPSTSVTPLTDAVTLTVAPGTCAATAFAADSIPDGYSTVVVDVVAVVPGVPVLKPSAASVAVLLAARPFVELPFSTVTVTAEGAAAVALS